MGLFEVINRSLNNRHARRRAQARARSQNKRSLQRKARLAATADSAIQVESLESRILLSANVLADTLDDEVLNETAIVMEATSSDFGATITNHGVNTTHDESAGLQNETATPTPAGDADDNDINVSLLPLEFSSRLTDLGADPSGAIGAALSGYDGIEDGDIGDAIFTVTTTGGEEITGILFADTNGDPLVDVETGTQTLDGNDIFLYSDSENDNIIIGREGNGTTPDSGGDIVFAAYIEEIEVTPGQQIDGKLWVVQYEPIKHPGVGDPDDDEPIDLFGNVFVASTTTLEFSLENAPSGQNMFLMFAEANPTTEVIDGVTRITGPTIVATGKNPPDTSAGESLTDAGVDTINSSQAGGPTTFGSNNQMLTAGTKGNEGDGIVYTFVTGANQEFTIPNLSQTEADVETNVDFTDTFEARAAIFDVVQLQGGKTAVVQVSAFDTDPEPGDAFADGGYYLDDTPVAILEVVVRDEFGNVLEHSDGSVDTQGIDITIQGGIATISGVEANTTIEYTTDGDHNRVLIENEGDGKGKDSADFDIGAIQLTNVTTASASLQGQFVIEDDGPQIDQGPDGGIDLLEVDETDLTDDPTSNYGAVFKNFFEGGTDGEGDITINYVLSVSEEGVDSGLVDTATGEPVVLSVNGSGEIEGRTMDTNELVFVVSVETTGTEAGTVTLDQQRAVVYPDNPDNHNESVSLAAGLITLTRTDTITDGDGDTASVDRTADPGPNMFFFDDGPTIDVTIEAAAAPLVVDETDLGTDANANFADNFSNTSDGGADGTASISSVYALSIGTAGVTTNLVDVATGDTVVLVDNGGVIEGQTAAGDVVFTVSVDAAGNVELDQQRALDHPDATDPDDVVTLAADHILLTRTDTITDGDGDQDSDNASLDIGAAMSFRDDGPTIDVTIEAAAAPLVVDETDLGTDANANFADNFSNTSDGGADGTASISSVYALSIGTAGVTTNLVDVATGDTVVLVDNGGVIEGQTAAGDVVFTVSVDAAGNVELDQQRALDHPDATDPDDVVTLAADHILLTRTDTITDGDGDQDSDNASLDIGAAMSFRDDGPTIDVTIEAAAAPLVVDETDLGTDANANFADNFSNTSDGGADGTASISSVYALSIGTAGVTTNLVDVATGDTVVLVDNGGVIEGQTAAGDVVFTVSVDAAGNVELDQQRALDHPDATDPDDVVTLAADHILLTRTDTITDGDGDQDSDNASLDIGAAMSFRDDGPTIDVTIEAAAAPLVVDETDLGTDANANFADNFSNTSDGGADGTASISSVYALSIGTAGVTTNLVDVATGDTVVLVDNGGVIEGQTAAGDVVFTVTVDGSGNVELDQQRALEHPITTDPDDVVTLDANHIVLTRTDTITDGDGDTASDSESLDIGAAMSFRDDGPNIVTPPVQDTDPDLGATQWVYSGDFEYSVGADQNGPYLTSDDSDFTDFSLTGTSNEVAIGDPSVTWVSEDASSATFDVSFTYDHDRDPTTADQPVTGTLVFDKVNNTYTFTIEALQVDQDVTLGQGTGFETYDVGGTTPSTGPSPVATGQLGEGFYIQLTGFEAPLSAGGDTVVTSGELVEGTQAPVTLSSVALGVSGNTIQGGEAANIGFFETDPMGNLGATDFRFVTDFFIKFDGFETEVDDLVVVLELVDADDPTITTTRAIYVDQGDVYESDTDNTDLVGTRYEPIVNGLDNNDALLIIESNDYNLDAGDNWLIKSMQIISHDDALTGDAIDLNPGVGDDGGSTTGAMIQDDTSTGPIKIIDAGFTSISTTPPTLDLGLSFAIVDADGDSTDTQTIDIENLMTVEVV